MIQTLAKAKRKVFKWSFGSESLTKTEWVVFFIATIVSFVSYTQFDIDLSDFTSLNFYFEKLIDYIL